jgi:uncharacterized protein
VRSLAPQGHLPCLDLGRVGITPHPKYLCTEEAKRPEVITWAHGRTSFGVVPEFFREEWGIDLGLTGQEDAF